MVARLGKEHGLGEPVWAGSPRIGPLGGSERSWTLNQKQIHRLWR